jgi:hypothetical protein
MFCVYFISSSIIHAENNRRSVEIMDLLVQDTSKSFEEYATGIARSVDIVANLANDSLDSVTLSRNGAIGDDATTERTPEQAAQLDAYLADFSRHIKTEFAAVDDKFFRNLEPEVGKVLFFIESGGGFIEENDTAESALLNLLNCIFHRFVRKVCGVGSGNKIKRLWTAAVKCRQHKLKSFQFFDRHTINVASEAENFNKDIRSFEEK